MRYQYRLVSSMDKCSSQSQKPLEQGRVACYTGMDEHLGIDKHRARHSWCKPS